MFIYLVYFVISDEIFVKKSDESKGLFKEQNTIIIIKIIKAKPWISLEHYSIQKL